MSYETKINDEGNIETWSIGENIRHLHGVYDN